MFYMLKRKLNGRKTKRNILTLVFMIAIFVMSLGYGALSQYMEIEGMAIIDKRWDVEITNVTIASTNSGSGVKSFDTGGTVVALNTTLPSLTSTVTYTITLKNSGNMDGILYSIDQIEDENTNITYTISGVTTETTIAAGATVTATVTVQYKSGVAAVSSEPKKILLGFNFVDNTPEIPTYTVSVSSNNTSYGTVSPASQTVVSGSSATFTLSPATGYAYKSNTCGGTVSSNKLLISNVTANKTCTVTFAKQYTVSVTSNNTSYGTVSPASQAVASGGSATVILSPKTNYKYSSNTCGGTVSGNAMTISNVTANKSCTVYFASSVPYLSSQILANNYAQADSYVSFGSWDSSQPNGGATGSGLYYTTNNTEDGNKVYYYRGLIENNFVQFGKNASGYDLYWRIVRINEDGSIRLIYHGTSPYSTGTDLFLPDKTAFSNASYNGYLSNAHVGYMYGSTSSSATYLETHANTYDSNIKTVLDNWYSNNLLSYTTYIADAGFCNDRSLAGGDGIYWNETSYNGNARLVEFTPQFACPNADNDLFTTSSVSTSKGNRAFSTPIGLITVDELVYAGMAYLYSGSEAISYITAGTDGEPFWTMTPSNGGFTPYMWTVNTHSFSKAKTQLTSSDGEGTIHPYIYARPVINLKSTVEITSTSQSGYASNPYIVKTS